MRAKLRPGSRVITRDHGAAEVLWTGARRVAGAGAFAPVRFAPGALGNDRALLVSPQHRMLVSDWRIKLLFGEDDVLVAAKDLLDGAGVTQVELPEVTYVHILLGRHEIVEAEGAAAESLHLGSYALNRLLGPSRDEVTELFPGLAMSVQHGARTARRCLRGWEAQLLNKRGQAA